MEILYLLIPLSLLLVGVIIWVFLWAVRSGQFDDLEGPAHQILMDDDRPVTGQSADTSDETDGQPPAKPE
jgi:cbb3-type cytochrome oxidase maturation protein